MKAKISGLILVLVVVFSVPDTFGQQPERDTVSKIHKYVKVEVKGMACPFCAYGLEKQLKKINGAKEIYIDIQKGYATFRVSGKNDVTKEKLDKIVIDAGFKPGNITFSNKPFIKSIPEKIRK
ncbi:heavy-metal-associated domain-containing protein [Sunxiuqinia indica]|uniref:heavy-metal-associated domain-containing protein n=1 Tax=Sunxiuqinia indica TaxID=2692584 RepID=UPI001356E497|nr:heavy-metal-associated domain-containing protein [Sunxiuqinia indica]